MPTSRPLPVLCPERVRQVPRSFAWIDTRLRSQGFLELMRPAEIGLYLFLALAADKQGLSCWRLDRVERAMPCFDMVALRLAREELIRWNLLAYQPWHRNADDGSYQLLSVSAMYCPASAARAAELFRFRRGEPCVSPWVTP